MSHLGPFEMIAVGLDAAGLWLFQQFVDQALSGGRWGRKEFECFAIINEAVGR